MNEIKSNILKELCHEMGIEIKILSYGWIYKLSKDGKTRYIIDECGINEISASKIANDKYATYAVMKSENIPVIKHTMIFNPVERKNYIKNKREIWNICYTELKQYGEVVIKPNLGFQGINIYRSKNMKEIKKIVKNLLKRNTSISICPYYELEKEYRTIYLNGKILLIYEKEKPQIIGNGKDTIRTLVKKLKLPDNKIVRENLNKLKLNYIPKNNEKIELSWKHNLSGGATAKIIKKEEKIYKKIEELAIKVGKALNMTFASIDIVKTNTGEMYLLEINSMVTTTIFSEIVEGGKDISKEIYREALIEIFK